MNVAGSPPSDDHLVLGGRKVDPDTRARLFTLLSDFDRRDRSVVQRRDQWARLGSMLAGNAQQLEEYLETAEQVGVKNSGPEVEQALAEVERLVFNVCTAAQARVDHHRRAVLREVDAFRDKYDKLKHTLGSSDEHRLVVGLRQYVSHVGLPPLTLGGFLLPDGSDGQTFYVMRDALTACDEFKKVEARAALGRQPHQIDVQGLLRTYAMGAARQDQEVLDLFATVYNEELQADADAWSLVVAAWAEAGFADWLR